MIAAEGWEQRAEALRDELVTAGKLTSPEWQAAVLAVPRHEFVPEFYERSTRAGPANWELVSASSSDTEERWWRTVWTNTSLVTQLAEVGRAGRQTATGPASSSSAPSLMTRMLEKLDVRDGHRILEIGTGSGYNAALMSHRLGDHNVFSIDIDPGLVDRARERLTTLGYQPTLAAGDGIAGLPEYGPYDRIIATCAVSRIPWSWAEQTKQGGLVLVDLKICAAVGNLVLLRRWPDRLEGRFDSDYATFMHMRTSIFDADTQPRPRPVRNRDGAHQRTTTLPIERLWDNRPLWFLLHLIEGGRVEFGYAMDPNTGGPGPLVFSSQDGSWCELWTTHAGNQEVEVWEGGPRPLWASIEATIKLWDQLGQPGWQRFGLTVYAEDQQVVWLDDPTNMNHWSL